VRLSVKHLCPRCSRTFVGNVYSQHLIACADLRDGSKTCRGCGERKPLVEFFKHRMCFGGYSSRCKECERARNSGRRKTYDPIKRGARTALRLAMLSGRIVKASACEGCDNAGPLEAHHPDYSKPLAVRWLCRSCHALLHRNHRRPVSDDYYYGGGPL
jgi:hypothetical protein